ncbi:MAG: anti-sigma factor antagonist [Acidobacteria bacterium]|nr:MAG: anti-sigma factor antagonist [Acidobacteriota bacterium]
MEQDMALVITIRVISEVVVLDLFGRLWILDLPLRDKMNGFLNDGNRRFVVNLAGVEYIDSSGLGQLVSIWVSVKNRRGHLTLLNPTKRVQRLFEITRLNTIFEIFENELEAVHQARKSVEASA